MAGFAFSRNIQAFKIDAPLLYQSLLRKTSKGWSTQLGLSKGQIISKAHLVSSNSPKKWTNEFVFTTMMNLFVRFLGEFEVIKKSFRIYLTFRSHTEKGTYTLRTGQDGKVQPTWQEPWKEKVHFWLPTKNVHCFECKTKSPILNKLYTLVI